MEHRSLSRVAQGGFAGIDERDCGSSGFLSRQ